jgi:ABC-type lipoprotein export system ATPase subunit
LLKEGNVRINKYCENSVLLLGGSGEGKSTLLAAIGGYKLVARKNEE